MTKTLVENQIAVQALCKRTISLEDKQSVKDDKMLNEIPTRGLRILRRKKKKVSRKAENSGDFVYNNT